MIRCSREGATSVVTNVHIASSVCLHRPVEFCRTRTIALARCYKLIDNKIQVWTTFVDSDPEVMTTDVLLPGCSPRVASFGPTGFRENLGSSPSSWAINGLY